MKYQVDAVPVIDVVESGPGARSAAEMAREICSTYEVAHLWGGKVIAGYTLMTCGPDKGEDPDPASETLFLVMELPDDHESRH
jgi:hypothetical protein